MNGALTLLVVNGVQGLCTRYYYVSLDIVCEFFFIDDAVTEGVL
jgi:hypothetical protein